MAASGLIRARMTTATTGTGTVTLGSAVTKFATFAEAGAVNGATYTYCIEDGNDFEAGIGTYSTTGPTLTRSTVFLSKIAGTSGTTKLDLTGSAQIFMTLYPAYLEGVWTYVDPVATTSGSSVDFTGIPSTATEIVVYFEGMSSAGPDWPYVQLGTAGGVETTGYNSSTMFQGGTGATTTGFYLYSGAATNAFYGSMVLRRHDTGGTKWTAQGLVTTNNAVISTSGSKTLSAQLDRVRIGASPTTFDAGSVAIKYR